MAYRVLFQNFVATRLWQQNNRYQVYQVHYVTEDSQVFSSVTAKVYPKLQNNELLVVVTLTQIICFLLRSIMQNKTLPVSVFLI